MVRIQLYSPLLKKFFALSRQVEVWVSSVRECRVLADSFIPNPPIPNMLSIMLDENLQNGDSYSMNSKKILKRDRAM